MSKVSVIIPVYNTSKYLNKCLDSVCNQTLKDIEIICINDCSADNSLEILKEYASKDERIKIIDFNENKGAAAARNAGIDIACGEYIGFVDSDDFVDLDFYEKLYNAAVENDADAAKGNVFEYDVTDKFTYLSKSYDINDKIRADFANFTYAFTSAIYRTSLIQINEVKFPTNIKYFEDPYFSIIAGFYYRKVVTVDDAKYLYIRHSNSACTGTSVDEKFNSIINSCNIIFEKLNLSNVPKNHYTIVLSFLVNNIYSFWNNNLLNSPKDTAKLISTLSKYRNKLKYDQTIVTHYLNLIFENLSEQLRIKDNYINFLKANYFSKDSYSDSTVKLISVVNDDSIYEAYFKKNPFISNNKNVESIILDNTKQNEPISKKYNRFLETYDYKKEAWFIFCHPDWEIWENINLKLDKLSRDYIYGPIGAKIEIYNCKVIPSDLIGHCVEQKRNGQALREIGNLCSNMEEVDTFDCQALIIHSSLVKQYNLRFDENLYWDLYVEDFSINARKRFNIKSYAIRIECCHHSDAGFRETPMSYYKSLNYLNNKYQNDIYAGTVSRIGLKNMELANDREILLYNLRKNLKKDTNTNAKT